MVNRILLFLLFLAGGGLLSAGFWLGLAHYAPDIPLLVYRLLATYPWLTGTWLGLAIVGIDAAAVSARDTVRFGNVGQKASAQSYHGSKGGLQ